MPGVYGASTRLAVSAASTAATGERLNFQEANVVLREDIFDGNGMRGTFARSVEPTRASLQHVGGPLRLEPTPVEWALLLPWMYGNTASGTSYPLGDTLTDRYVHIGRDDGSSGKVYTYDGCKTDRSTIRATRGGALGLNIDVVGKSETVSNAGTGGAFPSLAFDLTAAPFMFFDAASAITIGGTARECSDFEFTIAWNLDRDRFNNSVTLTQVNPTDRLITGRLTMPYGGLEAVYNSGAGAAGVAIVATFTNGTVSIAFTFAAAKFGRRSPTWQGKNELMQSVEFQAFKTGSTLELATVLDSTV